MPRTRLGRSVGLPAAFIRSRQRHFRARPPSIAASLEPVVEQPVTSPSSGRVPQPTEHVHAATLELRRLRIFVLIDHVLVRCLRHQPGGVRRHPGRDERSQVQAGASVEQQLVRHHVVRHPRPGAVLRKLVAGQTAQLLLLHHRRGHSRRRPRALRDRLVSVVELIWVFLSYVSTRGASACSKLRSDGAGMGMRGRPSVSIADRGLG